MINHDPPEKKTYCVSPSVAVLWQRRVDASARIILKRASADQSWRLIASFWVSSYRTLHLLPDPAEIIV